MITLTLTPPDWSQSTGQVSRYAADGYQLPPAGFVLAAFAAQKNLLPEMQSIIGYFAGQGTVENWEMVSLGVNKIGETQDHDPEIGVPVGDPRPVLELPVTFRAAETHPAEEVRGKLRYDTLFSEDLPPEIRSPLIALWAALVPAPEA